MDTPLDIGAVLVGARRAKGLSQRQLGELLGVRQQQIARWEAGDYRTASLQRIDAVARALGVSVTLSAITSPPKDPEAVRDLGEIAARIRAHGDELRDRFHVERIGVFGSFVCGEQTASSDVDLLVDFSERPTGFDYFAPQLYCEEILGRAVDMVEARLLRDCIRPRVACEVVYVWRA